MKNCTGLFKVYVGLRGRGEILQNGLWSCLCLSVDRFAYSIRLICVSPAGRLIVGSNEKEARYKALAGKSAQAAMGGSVLPFLCLLVDVQPKLQASGPAGMAGV